MEYVGLLTAVFMLICWRRQETAYSASDFSRVSLQDTTLRSGDQNAGQDDNMTIATRGSQKVRFLILLPPNNFT